MNIQLHNFGNFKLDGGAMFGPVPKPVWSKFCQPDPQNRILMASNTLLIESNERRIVIDVGMGINFSDQLKERYALADRIEINSPATITDVIFTHLHFDHTGGLFTYNQNQQIQPNYPNARYHVQKQHLEVALNPSLKEKGAYHPEDLSFLRKSKLILIEGEKEIVPGISVQISNGHTRGLQFIKIKTPQRTIAFPSDLIPTSHHLNLAYHMSYDINAEVLIEEKKAFLEEAVNQKYVVVFQHDPLVATGQIIKNEGKYQIIKSKI